ncbi:DUF998 domain-containing protein [Stackebrandtia nassauensis]|uniref:DUF998 domain-containing protein n=1 Tax=Stackebrandtia nassauensis (strain DSM 44728 / CIP 108903 / NRRL B-16338 / NBRC 102104 / LLR-40K-21) TaxID=446470 RepID=D3PX35_STANL|nr:DUF998 domain-containing protein [Stackebrandtia nassauensis]ADD45259.1 hypothetical protein Snas_5629 [Stackebrandtia nassauensis DSM 44728]
MSPSILAMFAVSIVVLAAAWFSRRSRFAAAASLACWIATLCYFIPEAIAIAASRVPYNVFVQPMSALGVAECGTISVAEYPVCSPLHDMVNWAFVLNGLTTAAAAILLHRYWPRSTKTVVATALLVSFGLSNAATGFIPADVNLQWHVIVALPSMLAQIPALILLATTSKDQPALARWTYECVIVTTVATATLLAQPLTGTPFGGAAQRVMYASVWVWGIVAAFVLWRRQLRQPAPA